MRFSRMWATALADFRERSRRYSFWIFLTLIAYAAYLFLPPPEAGYSCLSMDGNRGVYNSAWVGAQVAMLTVTILALAGFYFVRGGIGRDIKLRVAEVSAATPLTKFEYIAGKALSNAMVLTAMTAVLVVVAAILQFVRGESAQFDLPALVAPFVVVIVPLMILIGALAAAFDAVARLRGGIGNVVFFVMWAVGLPSVGLGVSPVSPFFDLFGVRYIWAQMIDACAAAIPGYVPWQGPHALGFNIHLDGAAGVAPTFVWNGPTWSQEFLLGRLVLLALAVGAVGIGAAAFRRFDTGGPGIWGRRASAAAESEAGTSAPVVPTPAPVVHLTSLPAAAMQPRLLALVGAEVRLMLARVNIWWYVVAGGLVIAGLLLPAAVTERFVLPCAWIWPLLLWSQLGCREKLHETEQMIFCTPNFFRRQLAAQWLSGFLLAIVTSIFVPVSLVATGNAPALAQWLVGAAFIPTLAIACGSLTGGRKLFEVVYTLLWYIGPLNKAPLLDFSGSAVYKENGGYLSTWLMILAATMLLMVMARWKQVKAQ
ncbi:MAG: hypothetical protein IT585_10360 [candidate division Zixibacteria bacterium]|nr:hypothetical protein [candidate division Zixibacteria bacterium]